MKRDLNRRPRRSKLAAQWFGRVAEQVAVCWLRLKFYHIVARRHRSGLAGAGEIDIVARKGGILAIIEVKARTDMIDAAWALDRRQRERLAKGALSLLASHPDWVALDVRFDLILVAPWRLPRHVIGAWRDGD